MPAGITIKAFGHISSLLGASQVVVDCDHQMSVSSVLDRLGEAHPPFAKHLAQSSELGETLLIVRNGNIEEPDAVIQPGEVLVLVTPISGG